MTDRLSPEARALAETPRHDWQHDADFGEFRRIVVSYLTHDWRAGLRLPPELLADACDRVGNYLYLRWSVYAASGQLASEKGELQQKVDAVTAVVRMLEAPELSKLESVRAIADALRRALGLPSPPSTPGGA